MGLKIKSCVQGVVYCLLVLILAGFIFITGCLTASEKKAVTDKKVASEQNKDTKTTIPSFSLQSPAANTEEKPPEQVPSYPENSAYSEILSFPEYVVGPSDVLSITFWKGTQPETAPILVRPNGKISFSFLEDLPVVGLTPTQIDNLITEKLSEYVKNPRIDVVVKEYNSKKISLFGAINRLATGISGPGIYPVTGKLTMLDLILIAGGHSEQADLTKVELTRKGKIYILNLYSALFQGEAAQNIIIEAGDKIVIPDLPQYLESKLPERRVFILGEVRSPGLYRFKKDITVIEAISMASGITIHAVEEDTKILRGDEKKRVVLASNIRKFLRESDVSQNIEIEDGDVIFVPKSKISDVSDFFTKLSPLLSGLLYPALYRDYYTTGGGLRIDTGPRPEAAGTTVITPR